MHIHIIGICGTFMAGIAAIAKQLGHQVSGCDKNVYPPMSTFLEDLGIDIHQGYDAEQLELYPADCYVIGNALSRGQAVIEEILNRQLNYTSGPQWLYQHVLQDIDTVIAVSGTHGKTTTTSMIAHILEEQGLEPGFLIGGLPGNFNTTARLGAGRYFVIEADEYDTAFFDKRPKFIHYHPQILVINNLEFDHADIYDSLDAIKTQFNYLIRTVAGNGHIIINSDDKNVNEVIKKGYWSALHRYGIDSDDYQLKPNESQLQHLKVQYSLENTPSGTHNQYNTIAAIAAVSHAGVNVQQAVLSMDSFVLPKRRMENLLARDEVQIYRDFAHHPTAIQHTIETFRKLYPAHQLITILEPRSNTMRMGTHKDTLARSLAGAHHVMVYCPETLKDSFTFLQQDSDQGIDIYCDKSALIKELTAINSNHLKKAQKTCFVFLSNGGFDDIPDDFCNALNT